MKHIFGTVGLPGSGKSTFTTIAEEQFDEVMSVSMGDIVRKLAKQEGCTTSSEIGQFADRMRDSYGRGIFAEELIQDLDVPEDSILAIDGIRSPEEIDKLRSTTDSDCTIVYISAPRESRYERVVGRGREGEDTMTMNDFIERDEREIGWGFEKILEENYYNREIKNVDSLHKFETEVQQLINRTV